MKKISKTYSIINIESLNFIDFSQIGETSENTIRKSINELEFIIKYNTTPTFISDGTVVPLQVLNHHEALELMSTDKWTKPEPEE
jgi:uncharacterized protein YdhG (YjbR/CyaY superfamily)